MAETVVPTLVEMSGTTSKPKTVLEALEALGGKITGIENKVNNLDGAYVYRGTVASEAQLPSTNVAAGDVYNIEAASTYGAAGTNVAWNGSSWDALGETFQIADGGIATAKLADGSVTTAKLANGAVTADKLGASSVASAKIASSAVTTAKIANANVTADKLASSAVTEAKIASGAVTSDKLGTGSVTSGKIADNAVGIDKLDGFVGGVVRGLSGGTETTASYLRRVSGGDGVATITEIRGETLVWNQLVGDSASSVTVPSGHKYVSYITVDSTTTRTLATSDGTAIAVTGGTDCIFDLTLMFGAGNEPSTVAEFEALYPKPYYPYDAGSLLPVQMEGIETVGFNQWDEEWELGCFNTTTGANEVSNNQIRAKNLTPVIAGQTYYVKCPDNYMWVMPYDTDGNVMSGVNLNGSGQTSGNMSRVVSGKHLLTIPSGCGYIRFYMTNDYGTTYNHDICINISDPTRNGEYEPYWKSERLIPVSDYFSTGLKRVGDKWDALYADHADTVIGSVTLNGSTIGTANLVESGTNCARVRVAIDNFDAVGGSPYRSDKFAGNESVNDWGHVTLGSVRINAATIFIGLPDTVTRTSLANAWLAENHPTFYYALATPTTTPIDPPLNLDYRVAEGGTEEVIVPTGEMSAPPTLGVKYGVNAKQIAEMGERLKAIQDIVLGSKLDVSNWTQVARLATYDRWTTSGLVGAQFTDAFTDSHTSTATTYDMPWDVSDFQTGALSDGTQLPVMVLQSHWCLPFETQFSPNQAFLYAIDGLPAGTYNVTLPSDTYGYEAGTYQFTLTSALPAGGQLAGFFSAGATADVTAWASPTATTATETCTVTSGSGGESLGTFSAAGAQVVPASGTPETAASVTVDGTTYTYYGLNGWQRVSYGNNRWLHSPLRQWLNATGTNWYVPATVFDRPPAYVAYPGFLSMLPAELVAVMRPVRRVTATSYLTDGGTSSAPEYDVTYDKVSLPSWEEHYLLVSAGYGGTAGLEGTAWERWKRVAGVSTPWASGTTHVEYVQRDMTASHTARNCWMRSAYRGNGNFVACVSSSGSCGSGSARGGFRVAPACAIG